MTIYTVLKDESLDFSSKTEALMSFSTKEAAVSFLQGQIENVKQFWKNRKDYLFMETDENNPERFEIFHTFDYAGNHTILSILENRLVGVEC